MRSIRQNPHEAARARAASVCCPLRPCQWPSQSSHGHMDGACGSPNTRRRAPCAPCASPHTPVCLRIYAACLAKSLRPRSTARRARPSRGVVMCSHRSLVPGQVRLCYSGLGLYHILRPLKVEAESHRHSRTAQATRGVGFPASLAGLPRGQLSLRSTDRRHLHRPRYAGLSAIVANPERIGGGWLEVPPGSLTTLKDRSIDASTPTPPLPGWFLVRLLDGIWYAPPTRSNSGLAAESVSGQRF